MVNTPQIIFTDQNHWQSDVRDGHVHAYSAQAAIDRFGEGALDVVLGGRLDWLPLAETGPLSRGSALRRIGTPNSSPSRIGSPQTRQSTCMIDRIGAWHAGQSLIIALPQSGQLSRSSGGPSSSM